jgi:hypothetical protein
LQHGEVAEVSRQMGKQWGELFRQKLPEKDKRERFLELARDNEAKVEKILTRKQLDRLRQIALQRQGPRAFEDAEVTAALKLTARQREQIRTIVFEAFFAGRGCHPGREGPAKGAEAGPSPIEKIVTTVLTAEQQRKWEKLTGEPFKGPPPGPPQRPGPPGHFGPHGR